MTHNSLRFLNFRGDSVKTSVLRCRPFYSKTHNPSRQFKHLPFCGLDSSSVTILNINTTLLLNKKGARGSSSNAAYFSSFSELLSPETKHYLVLFPFLRNENGTFMSLKEICFHMERKNIENRNRKCLHNFVEDCSLNKQ